jgi:hypothetical protein
MSITLANLKTRVLNKLQDYAQYATATITVSAADASAKKFKLPKEHLVSGSVTLTVDGTVKTEGVAADFTVDYDSGWVSFTSAPGEGKVIVVTYQFRLFSDTDLVQAINQGLRHAWPYLPTRKTDTSLTAVSSTAEYTLPSDVAYIERLESSLDGGSTYSREYDWTTYEDSDSNGNEVRMLRMLAGVDGKLRMRYVRRFTEMSSTSHEMQKDAHIKEAAAEPVVYYACWQLLYEQIIRRQRSPEFLNDEAPNVPKVYEGMRFADTLRAQCDGMLNEYRATPRLKAV